MLSANIPNATRKEVYRRDGYRCALCDSAKGLQVHHCITRAEGGSNQPENLICLCWKCHAAAHGTILPGYEDIQPADVAQACVEYLADLYAEEGMLWNPWAAGTRTRAKPAFCGKVGEKPARITRYLIH